MSENPSRTRTWRRLIAALSFCITSGAPCEEKLLAYGEQPGALLF
jgi:hypothetical protein